jgi:outer membrane receptor for ferrienterochelin and colicin
VKKHILLRSCAYVVAPLAAIVVPTAASQAQQITTSITGQVTNESGAPVAGALVTVTDTRTGASRQMTTDSSGLFTANNLTTGGPYTITASATGYQGQTVEQIQTTLQGATQLTFALKPVAAEADAGTIVVTAARVRATQLEIGPGTSFTQQTLQAAPSFDRDIRDVIRMDPRVSLDRQDVSTGGSGADRISCLGGNDRFNTFTVDGIPQSDVYGLNDTGFSSRSSTPVPYDAVRETQVQFAPFDVEYGQFTGCAINVVTKSGGNRFHGGGFYEFTNSSLRGKEVGGRPVPPIQPDKRWGLSLGGPIIRDRLFFFGAYEKQTAGQSQDDGPAGGGYSTELAGVTVAQFNAISQVLSSVYGVDTGPLVYNRPYSNERFFGRLDWQITDEHRLELTRQRLKENTVKTDDFSTTNQAVTGLNNFLNSGTVSKYFSARLYSNWNDRLSSELRYARSNIRDIQDPIGGGEAQSDHPIVRFVVGIDNPVGTPDGEVIAGPGFSRSANDLRTQLDQFKGVVNYDAGDHKLKLGFESNHAKLFNLFVQQATGTLVFSSLANLQNGILTNGTSTSNPTPSVIFGSSPPAGAVINRTASGNINDAAASFGRSILSAYVQDDWRVNDALKIVGGVRLDWFKGDHPRLNPVFVSRYGFGNDTGFDDLDPVVMPRLGFTYNLPDFAVLRHSRLQGGFGIFSGGDPVVWFGNVFQNNGQAFATGQSAGSSGGVPSPCPAGPIDVTPGGVFTGFPACVLNHASGLAAAGQGFTQAVDPDLKLSTVWRANIGYQADMEFGDGPFGRGWHFNLDYVYSQYHNPFTIADLSLAIDITTGLSGFTIDGRPIYRTIDPLLAGCAADLVSFDPTPTYANVTAACYPSRATNRGEYLLTNAGDYRTHVVSFVLLKNFESGLLTSGGSSNFTFGYAYTNAHDRRNMYNSTAGSNFNATAVFDRQNPDASRAFYETRHNITFSGNLREKFFGDLATSLGWTFVARSGRPYSLTFSDAGNGFRLFNAGQSSSGNGNLVYLPSSTTDPNLSPSSNMTAVQSLIDFASSLKCAKKYLGRSIPRNTCSNDWYKDLDLRFSQELPGPGHLLGRPGGIKDKLTAYAMFDNFLNLLNKGWNIQHRRDFVGRQQIADISGIDAQGRYIISGVAPLTPSPVTGLTPFETANFINVSSSVWRIKLGVSYEF